MATPTIARTEKPELAGTFSILCGAIEMAGSLSCLANPWYRADISSIYMCLAVYMVGLFAIMGGVLALRRRVWGLALTGAICALVGSTVSPAMLIQILMPPIPGVYSSPVWVWVLIMGVPLWILGISGIVLGALSKQEFA